MLNADKTADLQKWGTEGCLPNRMIRAETQGVTFKRGGKKSGRKNLKSAQKSYVHRRTGSGGARWSKRLGE